MSRFNIILHSNIHISIKNVPPSKHFWFWFWDWRPHESTTAQLMANPFILFPNQLTNILPSKTYHWNIWFGFIHCSLCSLIVINNLEVHLYYNQFMYRVIHTDRSIVKYSAEKMPSPKTILQYNWKCPSKIHVLWKCFEKCSPNSYK